MMENLEFQHNITNKALFLFFLLLPFQFALNPSEGIDLAVSRLAVIGIGGLFLVERLRAGSWMFPRGRVLFPMAGFLLLAVLSLFWAEEPSWTLRKFLFLISFLPLWFLCADSFRREGARVAEYVASGFFFGAVAAAVVALFQFSAQFVFSLEQVMSVWMTRIYPIFLGEAFSQSVAMHPSLLVNISGKTILRAVGTFPDPHVAAFYFGMAIPFGLWLGAVAHQGKRKFFFFGAALLFLADLGTFSRGGYVGLFGMVIFSGAFFLYRSRERISIQQMKRVLLGIGFILLLSLSVAPIRERLITTFSVTEGSNAARIALWGGAVSHISERPFLGYGLGNYSLVVKPSANYREPIYIHNTYLDMWAELGLAGLLLFLLLFLLPLVMFFFHGNSASVVFPAALSMALFLGHSLFENVLFSVHIFPLLLFLCALLSWYNKEN